jgi:hypothetical protein
MFPRRVYTRSQVTWKERFLFWIIGHCLSNEKQGSLVTTLRVDAQGREWIEICRNQLDMYISKVSMVVLEETRHRHWSWPRSWFMGAIWDHASPHPRSYFTEEQCSLLISPLIFPSSRSFYTLEDLLIPPFKASTAWVRYYGFMPHAKVVRRYNQWCREKHRHNKECIWKLHQEVLHYMHSYRDYADPIIQEEPYREEIAMFQHCIQ